MSSPASAIEVPFFKEKLSELIADFWQAVCTQGRMNLHVILHHGRNTHHVSEAELLAVVAQAALDARRTLRVLERRTQSQDHPILLTVPETHYLKCLILEVLAP